MCGRFVITSPPAALRQVFGYAEQPNFPPRFNVAPTEPGYWAMLLGAETRTHPIGRVYRFVSLGRQERDLVGYFIELESRLRG